WEDFYQGVRVQRQHLPVYPFSGERYWHDEGVGVKEPVGRLHPLLHGNTSDFYAQKFTSVFNGDESFLRDHLIQGKALLPGVVQLEMALAATRRALNDDSARLALGDVAWLRPLWVETPQTVHIALQPRDDAVGYRIYGSAGEEETLYSEGRVSYSHQQTPESVDLTALQQRCRRYQVTGEECYAFLSACGMEYGPSLRGITMMHIGQDEALVRIQLPEAGGGSDYTLLPGIADAALQATVGMLFGNGDTPERPLLPFALASLEVIEPCGSAMWAWAREATTDGPARCFDIDVIDDDGRVCIKLRGLSAREQSKSSAVSDIVLCPTWMRKAADAASMPDYGQHVVLLCEPEMTVDSQTLCQRISGMFVAAPQCVVLRAQGDIGDRYEYYAVQIFEQIKAVLSASPRRRVLFQVVVTEGGERALLHGLAAMLKTARLENPFLVGQWLGLPLQTTPEQLAASLRENGANPQDSDICYRDEVRYVSVLEELKHDEDKKAELPWRERGVYLITGGAGGLGRIFAEEIIRCVSQAQVVLTRRSPPDEETLRRLSETGVIYRQVDVADRAAFSALTDEIVTRYGGLHGVIHCAGVLSDDFIIRKSAPVLRAVLAPKVRGVLNIDAATRGYHPDFLLLCSSASAVAGNVGQVDYAAANAFMDAFAHYRAARETGGKILSIN
ncbi:MAG: SDR family oxidoreductase, partial [Enterobacter roggenkampii]